ncbi:MAG: type II 3-dehydroquinate dehydratase [Syntrophomonadaceae bacterium]|jgi:3-dehydroquinate dehydratase-2
MKLMVLNGPNINMTGIREKKYYGTKTFDEVIAYIKAEGEKRGHEMVFFQSNHEGDIIDWLQKAYFENFDGVIYNPGAHVHYSYAIKDAITASGKPVIEVHFSNIYARVPAEGLYRKESVTAPACVGYIAGFGAIGYILAIQAMEDIIARQA